MASSTDGRTALPALRITLLALLAEGPPPALPPLGPRDWDRLDHLAGEHRLRPLLHARHGQTAAIPAEIRARWHEAWRDSAFAALQLAAEVRHACTLLEEAGLAPIALKGAWLAWHAYEHPALRPMRDIDLLLSPETALAGFALLKAHGWTPAEEQQLPDADLVRLDKHMPPLLSPGGIVVELHLRLWEAHGRMDHAAPTAGEEAIRARAIVQGGLRYLHPQDLLVHLIVHAVYDHRLDCGPLVLSDIAALLRSSRMDWPGFWRDAAAGGWEKGAALVLALVNDHAPGLAIPLPEGGPALPADLRQMSAGLLLQNLETRQRAGVAATFGAAGLRALALRLLARRRSGEGTVARDLSHEGGFGGWAIARLGRTLRELSLADVRRQSRGLAGSAVGSTPERSG